MELLTVQEAAAALGLKPVSVYANIRRGTLASVYDARLGRHFIEKAEVERYRRERRPVGVHAARA